MASAPSRAVSLPARETAGADAHAQLQSLRRQLGYGRRFRPGRNHLVLLAVLLIGFWVVLGFARTINQLNAATDQQAELAVETQLLSDRLAAGHRELELVQADAFQALQARGFGIGAPGEISFSVPTDRCRRRSCPRRFRRRVGAADAVGRVGGCCSGVEPPPRGSARSRRRPQAVRPGPEPARRVALGLEVEDRHGDRRERCKHRLRRCRSGTC